MAAVTALAIAAGVSSAQTHAHASIGSANKATPEYGTVVAGSLPSSGTPKPGGTLTMSEATGQTPTAIFPITTGANSGTPTSSLVTQLFTPLYYGPDGARPEVDYQLSLAKSAPVPSNHDKTFTITMKSGLKWSDGSPIDAEDVVFYIDLLKAALKASPANWGQYTPGLFPTNLKSVTTPNGPTGYKVVLKLTKAYNPGYFLYNQIQDTNWGIYPLPATDWNVSSAGGAHIADWATNPADAASIYKYLSAQGTSVSTFATNPLWKVVDGPFKLSSFTATNGSYVLVPNKTYGLSPKPTLSAIDVNSYTSETAILDALKSGSLDIGGLDPATQLGSIPELRSEGYSIFGTPGFSWYGGIINFKDTTDDFNKIIVQPYIKRVLGELTDQPAVIKGVYHGWAVPASGPIPSAPDSPYAPADAAKPAYPFDPKAAATLLKAHGWDVKPGGQSTCAKSGSGAGECGAGIPVGTPFKFVEDNVPESTAATGVLESEALASQAKESAGITITLVTKTFNTILADDNDQAAPKYDNDWGVDNAGGIGFDYYPTMYGLLTPGAGFNEGDFADPEAIKLMTASAYSNSPTAVQKEDEYLSKNYPVLFSPDPDQIIVVSHRVGGSPDAFLTLGYQAWYGNGFYLKK